MFLITLTSECEVLFNLSLGTLELSTAHCSEGHFHKYGHALTSEMQHPNGKGGESG